MQCRAKDREGNQIFRVYVVLFASYRVNENSQLLFVNLLSQPLSSEIKTEQKGGARKEGLRTGKMDEATLCNHLLPPPVFPGPFFVSWSIAF